MYCLWCGQLFQKQISWTIIFGIKEQELICEKCRQTLLTISGEICRICGRMLDLTPARYVDGDFCIDCIRWQEEDPINRDRFINRSLYVYNEGMQEFMNRFKFRGDAYLIQALKMEWKQFVQMYYRQQLIVPIPLSNERLYERGFNQSKILAQLVTNRVSDVLIRPHHLKKQSKKTRKERMRSLDNTFAIKIGSSVHGKDVILIDDIYTTGTTVRSAAKTLYKHGAAHVMSLTFARAV